MDKNKKIIIGLLTAILLVLGLIGWNQYTEKQRVEAEINKAKALNQQYIDAANKRAQEAKEKPKQDLSKGFY